jgi:AspT/YidE/YbjL antiporter-like protein
MLFQEKWTMSDIALTVSILALVAVVGLFIGNVKFRGVGLGIGGVLFGGIIVGHFVSQAGMTLSSDMLHVIQEFGLILFVYTIGIQVGPGFFASLRVSGLRLNLFAVLIVIIGGLVTAILHKLFDIPLPVVLGIFSGAVTNTPALGAGQQILRDVMMMLFSARDRYNSSGQHPRSTDEFIMIKNVLLAFMICSGMTLLGGCSSVMSHTGGKEGTYPGTRASATMIGDDETNWGTKSLAILDMPFTAVLDTILLPWDVFRKDSSVRSRVEKSEADAQETNNVIPPAKMPAN